MFKELDQAVLFEAFLKHLKFTLNMGKVIYFDKLEESNKLKKVGNGRIILNDGTELTAHSFDGLDVKEMLESFLSVEKLSLSF